jgi:hypothetical protein
MNELGQKFPTFLGIGVIIMMLTGCAIGPTRLEVDFGKSLSYAESQQILDPAAQQNLAPVYGFDGKAAEATIERYRSTFEKAAPPPTFIIPIGTQR